MSTEVTRLLADAGRGDRSAWNRLAPLIYDELRQLAAAAMQRERGGHTLQPTALVHEAFLRLADQQQSSWDNRVHFYGAAAEVMRRVLVDHARARKAGKRGGGARHEDLDQTLVAFEERSTDLLALDEALRRLSRMDARQSRIIELRFFGGLTAEQTAELLGVSLSTVERGWRVARAWLLTEVEAESPR